MVPLTDKDTDCKRQLGEFTLERSHQGGPLPPACSGQLHALIPLMPERLGPLGERLVVQLPIRLDRTYHMPVPTAAEFEQARLPCMLDFLGEDGDSAWCRQVSRSSFVTGSGAPTLKRPHSQPPRRILAVFPCTG